METNLVEKVDGNNIKEVQHRYLIQCTTDELKAFIMARQCDLPVSKLPKL